MLHALIVEKSFKMKKLTKNELIEKLRAHLEFFEEHIDILSLGESLDHLNEILDQV